MAIPWELVDSVDEEESLPSAVFDALVLDWLTDELREGRPIDPAAIPHSATLPFGGVRWAWQNDEAIDLMRDERDDFDLDDLLAVLPLDELNRLLHEDLSSGA